MYKLELFVRCNMGEREGYSEACRIYDEGEYKICKKIKEFVQELEKFYYPDGDAVMREIEDLHSCGGTACRDCDSNGRLCELGKELYWDLYSN
jgi:hypothetical protein